MSIENIIIPKFNMEDPEVGTKLNSFLNDLKQVIEEQRNVINTAADAKKLNVKVGNFTCPASTGNYVVSGVGFQPRCVELFWSYDHIQVIHRGQGMMDYNGNIFCTSMASMDDAQQSRVSSFVPIHQVTSSGVDYMKASYVSIDADGFTLNFSVINTSFRIFWKCTA
jgi:ABC-type antimicrobial peptide transport system permease subunit